ncbi:MAG: ATP-binding protein [Chitinophagales bacterium]|nr:ATP-binding protein [Chitinophagales bacterium]
MIDRFILPSILKKLYKGKAIIILGPRQSGKTTIAKQIESTSKKPAIWLNADEPDIRERLNHANSTQLKRLIGKAQLVIIDEAQRIENAGLMIKLFTDQIKNVQVIATGSSSFELSDKIKESLAGRKWAFHLFPFSLGEMVEAHGELEESRLLEHRLVYGMFPEVVTSPGNETGILSGIADSVLYKDLFSLEKVKKPALLEKLIKALALQMGSEVSYHELSQLIGADKETIERYVHLLERTFVIFRLPAYSRNLRNELKRARKIYFYDNGIRNSILAQFSHLNLRTDKGALWENYLVSERIKFLHYHNKLRNSFFWRTQQQQEIDYLEEGDGELSAFEFKWKAKTTVKFPSQFLIAYPNASTKMIDTKNYFDFLL